jgi:hypothetical protein
MFRVLMISPHFPPDATAGAHRVRVLAPHLQKFGWDPTVLTVRPEDYEGQLDRELAAAIPASLRVVRTRALPAALTRRFGIGDLGLRSLPGLYRAAVRLLGREPFDAIFITIFPAYPALLGPPLARRFGLPFVLDYQDPWVNAWGVTIGGGPNGRVDWKSRASRRLAEWLEPIAVRSARAITAVSPGTWTPILERNPAIHPVTMAIPIGVEPADFSMQPDGTSRALLDPDDGFVHLCSAATVAPLGLETIRALFVAAARLREHRPDAYARLRFDFIGTTAETRPTRREVVLPLAREAGVAAIVRETPTRLPYSTAIRLQQQAAALLALGSAEPHYTPSKIYPLLLARRPVLAIYHEQSSVVPFLRAATAPPSVRLITYADASGPAGQVEAIAGALADLVASPRWSSSDIRMHELEACFAETLAGRLAAVLDQIVRKEAAA